MPHQIRIKVRGYHLDVFQHVNNARYLEFLDKHGAFLITYSNAQVCKALNISQFSLYNYLRMIRGGKDGAAEPLPMGK